MAELMAQACARCWRRKQRCDRELPACRKCRDADASCVQRRFGADLDPNNPEQISYIESLRERVRKLELQASETQTSPASASGSQLVPPYHASEPAGPQNDQRTAPGRQSASHETTKQVMDYLPLSAMAELRDRQQVSRGQYSFEAFANAATSASGADLTRSDVSDAHLSATIQTFYKDTVPSGYRLTRNVCDSPVQFYLTMCDIVCPFLDREAYLDRYATVMARLEQENHQVLLNDMPGDLFLVYISVATGILLMPGHHHRETFAISIGQEALQILPRIVKESDDACVVRSLIASAIFAMYSPIGGSPWHLVGLALARSVSAGMHTAEVSEPSTADQARSNTRLFWALYALDSTLSAALDRPFLLQDHDITAPKPSYTGSPPTSQSDHFIATAVQDAHLLRDIRRKSSMSTVFHLANHAHWKEMNTERNPLPVDSQLGGLASQFVASVSCKLILQILKASTLSQSHGSTQLHMIADLELQSMTKMYKDVVDNQQRVLTMLDALDITAICVYMVDRYASTADVARLHTNAGIRTCLQLLSPISGRFSGVKQVLEILWLFIDLTGNATNVADGVLELTKHYCKAGMSIPGSTFEHMRAILLRRSAHYAT